MRSGWRSRPHTFTIVAVFVPVSFMKGIVGRFFYQFGITVTFAVLISLLVSFTLDPMLSSRWVDPDMEGKGSRNWLFRRLERFNQLFDYVAEGYRRVIAWSLDHRKTVVLSGMGSFVAALFLAPLLGSSFMPDYDRAEFQVDFSAAPEAGIEESRGRMEEILKVLHGLPGVELTYGTMGAGETGTVREGSVYVKLKEKHARQHTQEELQDLARGQISRIAGIIPSIVMAGSMHGGKPINMNLRGDDLEVLQTYSERMKKIIAEVPGVVDVSSSLDQDKPELRLKVDRARAVNVGLSTIQVTPRALVGGKVVTTYEDHDGDAYDVRVRLPEQYRRDPTRLERLTVLSHSADGKRTLVPLGDVVQLQLDISPAKIQRLDLRRQVILSGNTAGVPLGEAIEAIRERSAEVGLPTGYGISFSGEAEDMAETFRYIFESLALAVIFIYLILAAQFVSDPLSIMLPPCPWSGWW
jgi:HAE1 family hydrophobic/amphiphilic exporter-1